MDCPNGQLEFALDKDLRSLKRNGTLALGLYNEGELVYGGDPILNESGFLD